MGHFSISRRLELENVEEDRESYIAELRSKHKHLREMYNLKVSKIPAHLFPEGSWPT